MKPIRIALALSGLLVAHGVSSEAQAAPRITRIVNNASYIADGLPGGAVAAGSIFAVFGEELGPAQLSQTDYPLPTTLEGTAIRISVGGAEVSAFLVYTSARQVAAILPSSATPGRAVARLTYNGQTSEPFAFNIVRSGPGLFTLNSAGSGPAVLTDANFGVLTWTNPARPGQTVIAWGTGIGPINSPDNERPPAFDPQLAVEVFVGGKLATVRYRGRAPGFAGLDQLVFDIPQDVTGCGVSLAVRVAGNTSNFTTIPVAPVGRAACSDPNGFRESDLANIPAGGMRIGNISLNRVTTKVTVPVVGTIESTSDVGGASFIRFDPSLFVRSSGLTQASYGSCSVLPYSGEVPPGEVIPITALDAGASLTVTGPGGTRTMAKQGDYYSGSFGTGTAGGVGIPGGIPGLPGTGQPLFLNPGDYTVTGPGGRDVGAFTANIRLPAIFRWTNEEATTRVVRSQDLTITWSGGDPARDYVYVIGGTSRRNPVAGATFYCSAPASAGRLVVPSVVLSALPPSESVQGAVTGTLSVFNAPTVEAGRFTAPGIDIGVISYGTGFSKNLAYE